MNEKRVHFSDNIRTQHLVVWKFAARTARMGDWRKHVADRIRFQQRISQYAPELDKVLSAQHREKVWSQRFVD